MRTTAILSSAFTVVTVLASFTAFVTGFSTAPRMVLEGWRNVNIHTRFRTNGSTVQLHMSENEAETDNSNDTPPVEPTDVMIDDTVSLDTNESEPITDAITEDTEEEVVTATEVVVEEEDDQGGETIEEEETEAITGSEIESTVTDEADVDEEIQKEPQAVEMEEDEEETSVEDESDDESEIVAVEADEIEDMESEEDASTNDEDVALDEDLINEEDEDEIEASAKEDQDDDSVPDEQNVEEETTQDTVEQLDDTIESSTPDDAEEGQDSTSEDAVVETSVYFASRNVSDASDTTSTNIRQEIQAEGSTGLNIEAVAAVAGEVAKDAAILAGDIAKDVLSVLRFSAANFLTASLPENQREDLLRRMGATALPPASERAAEVKEAAEEIAAEKIEAERASIQEEIAIARAEEAQKSESKWNKEKEEILQEMEEAASARVENELKIQKMKLEEEAAKSIQEKEQALLAEKERLEKAIQEEKERMEALEAEKAVEVEDLFAVKTDEEIARNEELQALIEKRQDQQAALESIEEELRASVANEEKQREQLEAMFEKRQGQQEELNTVEANLRAQVQAIESEKARYQQLVDGLNTMKKKAQEFDKESEETPDDPEEEEEVEKEPDHPVLGPVVADLGYKRIHLISAGKLGTIPVWNRNRIYRNNRAKSMAAEKIKSMELGFPGVIGLYEASSGKLSIVDGQHRVGMMASLKETMNKKMAKGDDSFDEVYGVFDSVLVEVYPEPESLPPAEGDAFAEKLFLEINKAEPVKLIDMPGVASAEDRKIITEAVESLQGQFQAMFSSSQRCRVPNVNVDNLRSVIFGANILKRHKLTTSKKLLEWLLEQNAALGDVYENDSTKQKLVSKKQWTKASANNFYLGLESSWLYK